MPRGAQAAHRVLAALLVPRPLPHPRGLTASSGSFLALTTFVISRAGGVAGRAAPPFRFPFHPGQAQCPRAGRGAGPELAVNVPLAPAAPLGTNH